MPALETPQASDVDVNTITVKMKGANGPEIQYWIDFGQETPDGFDVAYQKSNAIVEERAALFVQQFQSLKTQFLQFLANIGEIPPLAP